MIVFIQLHLSDSNLADSAFTNKAYDQLLKQDLLLQIKPPKNIKYWKLRMYQQDIVVSL